MHKFIFTLLMCGAVAFFSPLHADASSPVEVGKVKSGGADATQEKSWTKYAMAAAAGIIAIAAIILVSNHKAPDQDTGPK